MNRQHKFMSWALLRFLLPIVTGLLLRLSCTVCTVKALLQTSITTAKRRHEARLILEASHDDKFTTTPSHTTTATAATTDNDESIIASILHDDHHQHHNSNQNQNIHRADSYVRYWDHLLQQEHNAAVAELRDQRHQWSRRRLEASGISLFDVFAEPDSELYGEKIIRIYRHHKSVTRRTTNNKNSLRDCYTRGDVLIMTPTATVGRLGFQTRQEQRNQAAVAVVPREICVVDVDVDWLTASVGPSWPAGLWESRKQAGLYQVRLDRTVPKSTLIAQKKALDLVRRGKAGCAASLLVDTFYHGGHAFNNNVNNNSSSGNKNTTSMGSEAMAARVPPRLEQIQLPLLDGAIATAIDKAKEASSFQPNSSQQESIAWALKRSLSLIQGPAGTGKTLCAALLIAAALRVHPTPPTCQNNTNKNNPQPKAVDSSPSPRVLAVAHSNGAADVLLQALLNVGVPAVRVGRPASVSTDLRHRTVVAMADKHPEVKRLRAKAMDVTLDRYERNAAAYEVTRCINEVRRMIATTTPVVVASCIGAHQLLQEGFGSSSNKDGDSSPFFPIVVLDEAAQTTEPALMCALAAAKAEQVIFLGDTQQLPPTVASDTKELRDTLGVSPMARLEASHVGQRTLRVQYRMAPALLQFPSRYFYNGLVTCAESLLWREKTDMKPPAGFPWPNSQPMAFVRVGPNLETAHELGGKSNPTEADLVVKIVLGLLSGNQVDARGIAIISPYAKQVQLLRTMLSARNVDDIRVGTVDSFQGQETDLVVFSAVRSNSMSEIGFLRDPRRLCVALTRARRGLIVVGDPNVLQSSRPWNALLDSCRDRGCFLERLDLEEQYTPINNNTDECKDNMPTFANDTSDAALRAALQASLEVDDGLDDLFAKVRDASST